MHSIGVIMLCLMSLSWYDVVKRISILAIGGYGSDFSGDQNYPIILFPHMARVFVT